jgi:tetratricopeptide (TPR) repeat protein
MFLTHIDERGADSPPILVANATAANRAVNIPEFVNIDYDDLVSIRAPTVAYYRHVERGNELARRGRVREAIAEYRKALEAEPTASRIAGSLGMCLLHVGRVDEAVAHLERGLRTDPMAAGIHSNLAVALLRQGKYERAIEHCRRALAVSPGFAEAHHNLGVALEKSGRHDRAVEHHRKAVELKPGYAAALRKLAAGLYRQGRSARAVPHLEKLLELNPRDAGATARLAWILAACPRAGVRDGPRAVALAEPLCAGTRYRAAPFVDTLAAAYAEAGRFEEAVRTATLALRIARRKRARAAEGIERRLALYRDGKPYRYDE